MGRDFKPRSDFQGEITQLTRIRTIVMRDEAQTALWRDETAAEIAALITKLMDADGRRRTGVRPVAPSAKRGARSAKNA